MSGASEVICGGSFTLATASVKLWLSESPVASVTRTATAWLATWVAVGVQLIWPAFGIERHAGRAGQRATS